MKIQCDVCNKDDASVFCTADEAALCDGCDHRVHHANKLASKHQRFSLIHPSSSKESPLCDICQERRAFLFCQQDRAILCRECDGSIHSANEHTQKHNRYLFTGVKLSATSTVYASSDSAAAVTDLKPQPLINKKPISVSSAISSPPSVPKISTSTSNSTKNGGNLLPYDGVGSMSSISEYLTETLPGWHVEDLLDFSSNHPFGFCKADNGATFFDDDIESNLSSFSSENMGIWVPQAPNPSLQHSQMGFKETTKEATNMNTIKANYNNNYRSLWNDDGFTVPQISPPSVGSKRSRPF
ncbi:putative transcription factor interactor and regulator Znf-B family [Rosa chinensis]|uniref:Putative transcription factor interactor and regulator Znf-B family n=1 Tax=Rosa chinensis TaxID=74649 RepID=A0A2P6PZ03_ROSCH|nr:B-box zinc finger protein 21 [Rosa chinensis]PRQ27136.1 putative transcription factor interactor and regulator Znf-B family [Rosa chinensis]